MGTGYTGLDNREYDNYLVKRKDEKELLRRKAERKAAVKRDGSGWHFGIDSQPVKTKDLAEFRRELDKRGLAIYGEYTGKQQPRRS